MRVTIGHHESGDVDICDRPLQLVSSGGLFAAAGGVGGGGSVAVFICAILFGREDFGRVFR